MSFIDVEFLENFSISEVTHNSKNENKHIKVDSDSKECLIEEANIETEKEYSYTVKINFHADIFGTFKQTVVFDFGTRPLLSKVKEFNFRISIFCFSEPYNLTTNNSILNCKYKSLYRH